MIPRHLKIRTEKTGHIYTFGDQETAQFAWMAFHGYGQMAARLISKFRRFDPGEHYIIAPEGLHRFYWEGVTGQPAASWMTSLDRQDDIADYVRFLDRASAVAGWGKAGQCTRLILGFSQGCATAWRWILNSRPDFDTLVLWAGWLPEDMQYENHLIYLRELDIHYVYGTDDEYLTPERLHLLKSRFFEEGLEVTYHPYTGKHRIPVNTLEKVFKKITGADT